MSASVTMLAEVPIFALLDPTELAALVPLMEAEGYNADDTIYSYGDAGETIYIVRSGRIQVWVENNAGQRIVLSEVGPGEVFGEISFLDGGSRTANACAIEDSDVLALDREGLLDFIDNHAHAALDLLTVVGRRLRAHEELLRNPAVRNVNIEAEERQTFGQRIADRVAHFGGSWTFILGFLAMIVVWMIVNSILLATKPFDSYPYILLNLVLSCLAAIQAPIIIMSQNRQAAKDRLQSDSDYAVNLRAEMEIANLHKKLDRIYEMLQHDLHASRRGHND